MERLHAIMIQRIASVSLDFKRYLYHTINWQNRLIAIKGARGVGKTTLMLQYIREHHDQDGPFLYASLDDIYFASHSVAELAGTFYREGGKVLFLDEVHKYPTWSIEIKNIYDSWPGLKIVFTSSSVLQIYKGFADLSRRVVMYDLQGLSFREYLWMTGVMQTSPVSMNDLLTHHLALAQDVARQIRPLAHFREYLHHGYYPFFMEDKESYHQKLINVVNLTLENDLPFAQSIDYSSIHKLKKLLYILATSVPYKPNILKLSEQVHCTRATVLQFLTHLHHAGIIRLVNTDAMGGGYLSKPEKIWLHNTNLMFALAPQNTDKGNMRETFFINQTAGLHDVTIPPHGDFMIDKTFTIEVGGKGKSDQQIAPLKGGYIAADDVETGYRNKIPLWLFGFLY